MTMRSQEIGRPLSDSAPVQTPPAYDSPEAAIEEIFGPSVTGEGYEPAGQAGTLVADLSDINEALMLRLEAQSRRSSSACEPIAVLDLAEADRFINTWLKAHPHWTVERRGDGWITHSE